MAERAYPYRVVTAQPGPESLCNEIQKVLELLATGAPLSQVLESLVLAVEAFSGGMIASILLLTEDGKHLKLGAGPRIPPAYSKTVEKLEIGPRAGSCGTAAFLGMPVYVSDILADPRWEPYRDLAKILDFRACWSAPIFSRERKILGTFALYFSGVRSPKDREIQLIEQATHAASIAIEHDRLLQDREKAVRDLKQALREHQELVESIDGIVWEADRDFHFTFVSKQSLRILGYPPEQWINEAGFWADHLHADDRESAIAFCREQVDKLADHQFVYRMIASNGNPIWIRDIVSVIAEQGKPVKLRGVMIDVSEAKRAEIALEEAHEELRRIAASISDYLWSAIIDRDGNWKYMYYSPVVLKMTGRPAQFYRDNPERWLSTVYEEDQPRIRAAFERISKRVSNFEEAEYRIVHPDGTIRWVRDSATVTELSDGCARVNGVVSDITARKQVEHTREALLNREHDARIEAEKSVTVRDDFISIASHELKTPLTPLRMHLQLLKRQLSVSTEKTPLDIPGFIRAIEDSDRELTRLSHFIDDLLDVSRLSAGRLLLGVEEIDLSKLVLDTVSRYRAKFAESGCEPRVLVVPELKGYWDPIRIEQVIVNLLTNAMKYGQKKPVEISVSRSGSKAILVVRDYGIGIAKEDQNRIFRRFERIAPPKHYGGLGLGLYITREIVAAHGGTIRIESEPGKGAAFIVELPIGEARKAAIA